MSRRKAKVNWLWVEHPLYGSVCGTCTPHIGVPPNSIVRYTGEMVDPARCGICGYHCVYSLSTEHLALADSRCPACAPFDGHWHGDGLLQDITLSSRFPGRAFADCGSCKTTLLVLTDALRDLGTATNTKDVDRVLTELDRILQ